MRYNTRESLKYVLRNDVDIQKAVQNENIRYLIKNVANEGSKQLGFIIGKLRDM